MTRMTVPKRYAVQPATFPNVKKTVWRRLRRRWSTSAERSPATSFRDRPRMANCDQRSRCRRRSGCFFRNVSSSASHRSQKLFIRLGTPKSSRGNSTTCLRWQKPHRFSILTIPRWTAIMRKRRLDFAMASSPVLGCSRAMPECYVGIPSMFRIPGSIVRQGACDALPRQCQGVRAGCRVTQHARRIVQPVGRGPSLQGRCWQEVIRSPGRGSGASDAGQRHATGHRTHPRGHASSPR